MTESNFYVEDESDSNPATIWERAIPGTTSTVDHIVATQLDGIRLEYEDLAFAVLARVLAPDPATVDRVADVLHRDRHGQDCTADIRGWHPSARAVLAVLAEDPAVSP